VPALRLPPLSLYVHIPWCERKCPYCDFNSHQPEGELPEAAYVETLLADLDASLPWVQERELQSIFIGGGTPSLFSAAAISRLLHGVRQRVPLATDCEITLEANPGSAEASRFAGFAEAGVTRLSLGVQSFQQPQLEALGRVHNADQARAAVAMAQAAGFTRINIDLMHGLPGQAPDAALQDLETALDFGVTHLSWYQLTIEPNTAFYKRPPRLPDEDVLADIQSLGERRVAEAGFTNYEVSAYAQAGSQCRHNLNYWEFGDYIGIGAGAHGKITHPESNQILRTTKRRQPAGYLAASSSETQALTDAVRRGDFMLKALRLSAGFARGLYEERTGLAEASYLPIAGELAQKGLLIVDEERVATTDLGRRFLDTVVAAFI
jgi:oxygen-independent coproporphyrinogen-3 oxidase